MYKMLSIESAWRQYFEVVETKPRQMFVTRSQMLADKVQEAFRKVCTNHGGEVMTSDRGTNRNIFPIQDDNIEWSLMPEKFRDLKEEHFPLFISFDRLCDLLEGDLDLRHPGLQLGAANRPRLLSYNVFMSHYWPTFPKTSTKGLGSYDGYVLRLELINGF
ncbi:hypothetical protein PHLCEN_2v8159 [Hermanssonia centrifuga]|uniref:Uncharacterized protein n=1 Tax=Hermanssonia centrifuga TaxID=98765 RepID=A0A2R6NV32_9APHY|nr:hypothetical protein PHLCEN_2v8159 [Hermanssonia centrifuga]